MTCHPTTFIAVSSSHTQDENLEGVIFIQMEIMEYTFGHFLEGIRSVSPICTDEK